jgi:hypothetical protein
VEAVPIKNQEASTWADALMAVWVLRFDVLDTVIMNKGTQFASLPGKPSVLSLH